MKMYDTKCVTYVEKSLVYDTKPKEKSTIKLKQKPTSKGLRKQSQICEHNAVFRHINGLYYSGKYL